MIVLMLAGVAKLVELDRFAHATETWTLVPAPIRTSAVLVTPIAELVVGLGWLLGVGPRRIWLFCAAGLITAYTLLIGVQTAVASPPDCDCLGLLLRHAEWMRSAQAAMFRNGLLLLLLFLGWFLAAAGSGRPWPRRVAEPGA